MAKIVNGTKVITNEVRLSYLHWEEPYAKEEDDEKKYSTSILIPKEDTQTLSLIEQAVNNVIEANRAVWDPKTKKTPKNLKTPLRDGDAEKDLDEYPEYEGMMFLNCSSKRQPGVLNEFKQKVIDDGEVLIEGFSLKSGDYAKVSINFYAYDVSGSKGVAAGLQNIMKTKEGPALGGNYASAEDDFADEEAADEDDLLS